MVPRTSRAVGGLFIYNDIVSLEHKRACKEYCECDIIVTASVAPLLICDLI
jgi:hypothetical protein